jgi:nucleoside-triphosphatase
MAKVLIEGPRRGEILRQLFERLDARAGGVALIPVRQGEMVVGFRARSHSGREGTIAHMTGASLYRAGKYKVNIEEIDAVVVPAIRDALRTRQVVLIEEIGKMTLFSEKFREAVREAFGSSRHIVAAVQERPHGFVERLRALEGVRVETTLDGVLALLAA